MAYWGLEFQSRGCHTRQEKRPCPLLDGSWGKGYYSPFYGTSSLLSWLQKEAKPTSSGHLGRTGRKGEVSMYMYEIRQVRGHVEVYLNGRFCFSADTRSEAQAELDALIA